MNETLGRKRAKKIVHGVIAGLILAGLLFGTIGYAATAACGAAFPAII